MFLLRAMTDLFFPITFRDNSYHSLFCWYSVLSYHYHYYYFFLFSYYSLQTRYVFDFDDVSSVLKSFITTLIVQLI